MQRILCFCLALAALASALEGSERNLRARRAEENVTGDETTTTGFDLYGYSGSGKGYEGGYGGDDGDFGGGCMELWCYPNVYDETTGEIDWDATYSAEPSCATYDEGCPCNRQYEVQCDSYGFKVCTPISEGCYDPFAVTCSDSEQVCRDEWSAFCWDKMWGNCPLYCTSSETHCSSYAYDRETGEIDYEAPANEFCANATTGCPCDEQYEDKCTDSYGYSYCTPKIYPCPISCGMDEQVCYSTAYLSSGEPDWSMPGNQSCAPQNGSCPCNSQHEELCVDDFGSYCMPTFGGATCPISCTADQIYCYETPYDEFGEPDWTAVWQETCQPAAEGCPCNEQWEKKCTESEGGWSWCIPKSESCPIDCGVEPTCYHWSGNTSCGTSAGCTCEGDEHSCQDAGGWTECYPKVYYETGCPLVCNYDTHLYCYEVGFDSMGLMTWTEFCHPKTSADDYECPVICKTDSSKKCDTTWGSYCVTLDDTCPEVCTSEQQNCWVTDYDTAGEWLGGADVCAPAGADCPCGQNSVLCTESWGSYCEASFYGCPITCGMDEKYCYPISYTPQGDWDSTVPVNETCVNQTQTCPCGYNAKPCKWTDDWGFEEEYCMPDAFGCPVTCTEGQKRCYQTDYNASGYPVAYSEVCTPEGQTCQCGLNSQSCYDPWFDENFCYPTWDFWSNTKVNCPVYCKDNEDYCFIPSYDAQGDWLSFHEYCVPTGTPCDCSKGQNVFECTWTDPFYGSWTECLPTTGGFCPATCPAGQVACDMVEDYLPNGTSLGFFSPPSKCAASFDQCPCGKEAERCPGAGCIFKDEGCPVTCTAGQKKCYIVDYNGNGDFISDREACVAETEACPCGKNTAKCENSDVCLSRTDAAIVCPCKASETECSVVDYDKAGQVTQYKTECVKEGTACPCGKNTISCPDPNDALAKLCSPSAEHKKCPSPCAAEAILAGNKTCVQTNLDSRGSFKSETVSCLGANQTCPAGEGMKSCPSGARIASSSQCRNLYASGSNQTRRLRQLQSTATRLVCNAIISMTSLQSDAVAKSDNARVQMNSVLQIPNGLSTSLAVKTATSGAGGTVIYTVDNKGAAGLSVTPAQVCEQLKKMAKSSNPQLTKAVSAVGVINAAAGVNLELSSTTMTSRAQAAQQQRAAQAGVTTRSTTSTTTTMGTTGATTAGDTTTGAATTAVTTAAVTTDPATTADPNATMMTTTGELKTGSNGANLRDLSTMVMCVLLALW